MDCFAFFWPAQTGSEQGRSLSAESGALLLVPMLSCLSRGLGACATEFNRFTDVHLDSPLVVFGSREISQLAIPFDEPERRRDDADADSGVTGFQALQGRDGNTHAFRPGFQGFLAAQAGYGEVGTEFFDGGGRRRRELKKGAGSLWHTYRV